MKVLVACEESQAVTIELRRLGQEAYSCDVIDCSGGHPEWHIRQDVIPLLNGDCCFQTVNGEKHSVCGPWDMIIAFPPCTYLCVSGNRWFDVAKYGDKAKDRQKERYKAITFFMRIACASCAHIAIENPIGIMSNAYRKPDQIIQPYMFGDRERKSTCLWLKGLNPLCETKVVVPQTIRLKDGKSYGAMHYKTFGLPQVERAKIRSKTFPGVAKAMAEQWAGQAFKEDKHD